MKTTLSTQEAAELLQNDTYAGWSRAGAIALVEYIEQLEADTGTELEFDRVALRCDFTEYESLVEWADAYGADLVEAPEDDDDERDEAIRDYIQARGVLIEFDGGVIVSEF